MHEPWLVVIVRGETAAHVARLAEGLLAVGATAVEERPDRVITYLLPEPGEDPAHYVAGLAERLRAFHDGVRPHIEWDWLPDVDWGEAWKRGLQPRRVGERIIVAPSWTSPEAGPNDVVITIDPQMAFGTGEHASTRGTLRLLERHLKAGARVLDVGTGSAVLAIAAARLGAREVVGVETDRDSLINAQENIERNQVADQVRLEHYHADEAYLRAAEPPFDLIVANILSSVIVPLLSALNAALAPGGTLIVAGILQAEAERVLAAAGQEGFTVLQQDCEEEWWSVALAPAPPAARAGH
jgi:ribosomal protein L11 methyltransferase